MKSKSSAEPTAYELAMLAARICPEFCRRDPAAAIGEAIKLLQQAHDVPSTLREGEQIMRGVAKWDAEHADDPSSPFHKGYEAGVKLVTDTKRWSRRPPDAGALEWFRAFLKSKLKTDKAVEHALVGYRKSGFTPGTITRLGAEFRTWKKG